MPLLEQFVRPMTAAELRLLKVPLRRKQRPEKHGLSVALGMFLMIFGFFLVACLAATVIDHQPAWYYSILIAFGVSALVWIVAYPGLRREQKRMEARCRMYEAAIQRNEVHVTHIQSDEMVEFEEEEDEGACYAFQVNGPRIVFVSGQDYYASAKFPNNDFSLVDLHGPDGTILEGWVQKHGKKLKPLKKLPGKLRWHIDSEHLQVIEGDLADLERLLAKEPQRV